MWKSRGNRRIAEVPLFSKCTPQEIEHIDRLMCEVRVHEGEVLLREGNSGRECFVIGEGKAAVLVAGHRVATVERGAVVGEMALLDGGRRTATVIAETPMRVYVMDPASFDALLQDVPAVSRKIMSTMSERLRSIEAIAS